MRYIDTHCHLNGDYFTENKKEAIKAALENNVDKIILPGTTPEDSLEAIEMAKQYDCLFAAAGIHPSDATNKDISYLDSINPDDIVAIGEVGIDLYRDTNPPLDTQIWVFEKHIEFAKKHNKPVIVHMRDAEEQVYKIIKNNPGVTFIMHSFTASFEWAKKFIELGTYISISGIVTFKNAKELKEVASWIPLEKMLAETDAPFLTPVPHRGKHNKPAYVSHVVDYISELRNEDNIHEQIYQNSLKVFSL